VLQLPYWLMVAGAVLVVVGFIGALVSGKKADEIDSSREEPADAPRPQMPPLPSLLDSHAKEATPSS